MNYQVWTKDQYADNWARVDCGDLGAAKRTILQAAKDGKQTVLTVEVPYEVQLKVGEPGEETPKLRKEKKEPETKEEETGEHEANKS